MWPKRVVAHVGKGQWVHGLLGEAVQRGRTRLDGDGEGEGMSKDVP